MQAALRERSEPGPDGPSRFGPFRVLLASPIETRASVAENEAMNSKRTDAYCSEHGGNSVTASSLRRYRELGDACG
jgi:hypothetical protein